MKNEGETNAKRPSHPAAKKSDGSIIFLLLLETKNNEKEKKEKKRRGCYNTKNSQGRNLYSFCVQLSVIFLSRASRGKVEGSVSLLVWNIYFILLKSFFFCSIGFMPEGFSTLEKEPFFFYCMMPFVSAVNVLT